MIAYAYVADSPWTALTGADGHAAIADVPPGHYQDSGLGIRNRRRAASRRQARQPTSRATWHSAYNCKRGWIGPPPGQMAHSHAYGNY